MGDMNLLSHWDMKSGGHRRPAVARREACTPFVDGVQLHLERSLVLLHHVLEGHGGVLCVLPLRALPTHGGLAGLAVEVHHLRTTQEWFLFSATDRALTRRWVFPSTLSVMPTASRMWTVLHPASQEKRKGKLLCDRSQTEVDQTPGQLL